MSKIDISVSRSATINTGNYSSIKPTVSLTLKDVDVDKLSDKYEYISQALDLLMLMETINSGNEMMSCNDMGYKKYIEMMENVENPEKQLSDIMKLIDKE